MDRCVDAVMRWGPFVFVGLMPALVAGCRSPIPANLDSGITGTITEGPTCPVENPSLGDVCNDKPYAGTVDVRSADGLLEITRFTADNDGSFRVPLYPGTYLLDPLPGPNGFPHGSPQQVTVQAGTFTQVDISYDTGIR